MQQGASLDSTGRKIVLVSPTVRNIQEAQNIFTSPCGLSEELFDQLVDLVCDKGGPDYENKEKTRAILLFTMKCLHCYVELLDTLEYNEWVTAPHKDIDDWNPYEAVRLAVNMINILSPHLPIPQSSRLFSALHKHSLQRRNDPANLLEIAQKFSMPINDLTFIIHKTAVKYPIGGPPSIFWSLERLACIGIEHALGRDPLRDSSRGISYETIIKYAINVENTKPVKSHVTKIKNNIMPILASLGDHTPLYIDIKEQLTQINYRNRKRDHACAAASSGDNDEAPASKNKKAKLSSESSGAGPSRRSNTEISEVLNQTVSSLFEDADARALQDAASVLSKLSDALISKANAINTR